MSTGITPIVLEFGLTAIAVCLSLCIPNIGSAFFRKLERAFSFIAHKRVLSVIICGAFPCLLRVLILPVDPIPKPWIQDDFSYLLAADTFASGRLTNPVPALWQHFESFHITVTPTYTSMYFPAQGLLLAAGKIIAGHPWWGVWASCGFMCAALCWALQGWLPAGWAFLGAMIAAVRLALFSYWIDTYTGGAISALGGALIIGALPRILRHCRARDLFWAATGMALLALSRPYEGLLLSVPVLAVIVRSLWKSRRISAVALFRRLTPAVVVLGIAFTFIGYYDYRVYGNVLTPPYKVDRDMYAVAPHFLWQAAHPERQYRHEVMRNFYAGYSKFAEPVWYFKQRRSLGGFLEIAAGKVLFLTSFYLQAALLPVFIALPWALRDKRLRIVGFLLLCFGAGLAVETWLIPHYFAPALPLLYIVMLQCMRHLRLSGAKGLFLVRVTPVLCAVLVVLRLSGIVTLPEDVNVTQAWYGARPVGVERARVADFLQEQPGGQLALVRYVPDHVYPEWVYNGADIDGSKVVWAREMDPSSDRELLNYYKDRTVWLVEPDANPPRVSLYSSPLTTLSAVR